MAIDIDRASLLRCRALGELHFVLRLEWPGGTPRLRTMVSIAENIERQLATSGDSNVRVESWVLTKAGWSGVMRNAFDIDKAITWFEVFASEGARGATGRVVGGPRSVIRPHEVVCAPATFVRYSTSDLRLMHHNDRSKAWAVPDEVTHFLARRTVSWSRMRDCAQYLDRDVWWVSPVGDEVAPALEQAVSKNRHAAFAYARKKPFRWRGASFWAQGQAVYRYIDPEVGWHERLSRLREVLTWTPPHTDVGFVRFAESGATSWMDPQ